MRPLPHRPGLVVLVASLLACTSSYKRCQPGLEPAPGASPLRCQERDSGVADAIVADADVMVRMCGERPCDEPGDGVDTNNDRVDGELSDTIFLSDTGVDAASGASPDEPVRSLPTALMRAAAMNRGTILVQEGDYRTSATAMMLPAVVTRTVTIIGRYVRGAWVTRNTAAGVNPTRIVGSPMALFVDGARDVVLSGLLLEGVSEGSDRSAYGLVARNADGLRLREVVVQAQGARGGDPGPAGREGSNGADGTSGTAQGLGGSGGSACTGAMNGGGNGGASVGSGRPAAVSATAGGMVGARAGGTPGAAGSPAGLDGASGGRGADGADGQDGMQGGLGRWTREGFVPEFGARGEDGANGTGGGGGGAGLSGMAMFPGGGGGGGGGGGCGGRGGNGGEGGGASVGVYLVGPGLTTFERCAIAAGNGGAGGAGGLGGRGPGGVRPVGGSGAMGAGGTGGGGNGNSGGNGGNGGNGGRGGPGLGGPSVGIARVGSARTMLDMVTQQSIRVGMPGAHPMGVQGMPAQITTTEISLDEAPLPTKGDAGMTADASADATAD